MGEQMTEGLYHVYGASITALSIPVIQSQVKDLLIFLVSFICLGREKSFYFNS